MNFSGKTVLITGASAGIGAELARGLATDCRHLVLVARREAELEQLRAELVGATPSLTVTVVSADMASRDEQVALFKHLDAGGIAPDILIANAGIGDECLFEASDWSRLKRMIMLNVAGTTSLVQLFVKRAVAAPTGKGIVVVGSGAGIAWMPGSAVYSATKHYLTALVMNVRSELRPLGIEVALVCPGPVDSEFDKVAGIDGGLRGGPSQSTRISAAECAADTISLLKQSRALVVPGAKIRRLMTLYNLFPWRVRQWLVERDGRRHRAARGLGRV